MRDAMRCWDLVTSEHILPKNIGTRVPLLLYGISEI